MATEVPEIDQISQFRHFNCSGVSSTVVPEKFLLHIGGYSGGPKLLAGSCTYIKIQTKHQHIRAP